MWVALALAVLSWIVYRPALNRVFVMDQVWYFAELDGKTSLADGLRHYDYAATRRYWKGDDALFRPLLFAWLAIGNSLFSYHHVAWNVANLTIHVLVALALFRLLWTIRPSPFAYLTAALFVVMKPPLELVVWNHLGGYLLACLCLLIGLRAFVELTQPDALPATSRIAIFAAAFAAAGVFHETMVPIGVVAALIVVGVRARRGVLVPVRHALALFAPVLLFGAAYAVHVTKVARLTYVDRADVHSLFEPANLLAVVPNSLKVLAAWTREVALPSALTFVSPVFLRLVKRFEMSWSPLHLLNAVVVIALLILLARSVSRANVRRSMPLLILLPAALLAYAAVISLGRPLGEVLGVTYYLYAFAVLLVVLVYAVVDAGTLPSPARAAAALMLTGFCLINGAGTHAAAREIRRANHDASVFLARVARFVDARKHEPDFTFAIRTHVPAVDPDIPLKEGYPDDPAGPMRSKHLTEILFARYYRQEQPKYVFDQSYSLRDGRGMVRPSRVKNTPESTATAPRALAAGIGSPSQRAATVIATIGTRFE